MKYTIIGNSAAGISSAETLRKLDENSEITIISKEPDIAYSRCLISWYVDGSLKKENLFFRTDHFYDDYRISPILGQEVIKIDKKDSKLICKNGNEIDYDKLLIATGSRPFRPPISGTGHKNILSFHSMYDAEIIIKNLEIMKNIVIVGAGIVSLEAAYALARRGADVTVVEMLPHILPSNFDPIASEIFLKDLVKSGIKVITSKSIISIEGENDRVSGVKLSDGSDLKCQMVILATGVRANSEIASNSGLNVNIGIIVDEYLRTNDSNIFAAGDVIEIDDVSSGKRVPSATWYNAVVQGRFAAYNMVGQRRRYTRAVGVQSAVEFREIPAISFGTTQIPPLEQMNYNSISIKRNGVYRKLIIKGERLVGLIFVGDISNAGFYAKLIKNQINIENIKSKLLKPDFSYAYFKHMDFEEKSPYI